MNINAFDQDGKIKVPLMYLVAQLFLTKGVVLFLITLSEGGKVAKPLYKLLYWEPIAIFAILLFAILGIASHLSFMFRKKMENKVLNAIWNNQYLLIKWSLVADLALMLSTMVINQHFSELNLFVFAAGVYIFASWYNNDLIKTFIASWQKEETVN